MRESDVIVEFIRRGNYVKVTAIDAASGIEASIVGDPAASRERLEQTAVQKLQWVMKKRGVK
jgi:hypothetical protein